MGSESQNFSSLRPFFFGSYQPHWKFKIELYLDNDPIRPWDIVLKGREAPKATIDGVETTLVRSQWNNNQKEENYKNKKAMITLLSSKSRRRW